MKQFFKLFLNHYCEMNVSKCVQFSATTKYFLWIAHICVGENVTNHVCPPILNSYQQNSVWQY